MFQDHEEHRLLFPTTDQMNQLARLCLSAQVKQHQVVRRPTKKLGDLLFGESLQEFRVHELQYHLLNEQHRCTH